jgi:hypothetical protein
VRAYPRWRNNFRWLFARHVAEPRITAGSAMVVVMVVRTTVLAAPRHRVAPAWSPPPRPIAPLAIMPAGKAERRAAAALP